MSPIWNILKKKRYGLSCIIKINLLFLSEYQNKKKKNTIKKNHTVEAIPKTKKSKIVERSKVDTPKRQIHDRSLSWLVTGTSIKSGGVKLVLWVYTETSNFNSKYITPVFG
jgi:hypothetical protein